MHTPLSLPWVLQRSRYNTKWIPGGAANHTTYRPSGVFTYPDVMLDLSLRAYKSLPQRLGPWADPYRYCLGGRGPPRNSNFTVPSPPPPFMQHEATLLYSVHNDTNPMRQNKRTERYRARKSLPGSSKDYDSADISRGGVADHSMT